MWYLFDLYSEDGEVVKKTDIVSIYAHNKREAWEKAGEFAYENGYVDYNLVRADYIEEYY